MRRLLDSATFWVALGAAVTVVGGIFTAIGAARVGESESVWHSAWFVFGFVVVVLGCLALLWALILFLAHAHSSRHTPEVIEAPSTVAKRAAAGERYFHDETINFAELVTPAWMPEPPDTTAESIDALQLRGFTFERCNIQGPVTLHPCYPNPEDTFMGNRYRGVDFLVLPHTNVPGVTPEGDSPAHLYGLVVLSDCRFRFCVLRNVTIADSEEGIKREIARTQRLDRRPLLEEHKPEERRVGPSES